MTNLRRHKPKKFNICDSISLHVNKPCTCNTHFLLPSLIQAELIHDKDAPHSNEQKKSKDCQHGHHWWEPDISGSCLSLTYDPLRLDLCVSPCPPCNPKRFTPVWVFSTLSLSLLAWVPDCQGPSLFSRHLNGLGPDWNTICFYRPHLEIKFKLLLCALKEANK